MPNFDEKELMAIALVFEIEEEESRQKRKKKLMDDLWKKRKEEVEFATLFKALMDDGSKFYVYFRMSRYC